ncbi:MAG TPA: zinc-dependent alcohol dehydrogenase family protein [Acidimicrobiales bacterium]|nr:zinc-dependent alcohol dehydrogenase family protein [Acidimicrobiales bacterium]
MRAFAVEHPGPIASGPLVEVERGVPVPGRGEILVRVSVCGVCRTDLHLAEGDLAPRRPLVVPGHEIVGVVEERGPDAHRFARGDRVGVAWLRGVCGRCPYCLRGEENLCAAPSFTGWDEDGGFAEYALVHQDFAYVLPARYSDAEAAPLLCAGIIGFRALRRAGVHPGSRLGIYGFGASAHLCAQVALSIGATVHVVTRSPQAQALARFLGAHSAGDGPPPEPLDEAILFAPVGTLVPVALQALDRGGVLAVAGIHLSAIPELDYARDLFYERELVSVTANTRADGQEFLEVAADLPLVVATASYPFAEAPRALADLAEGAVTGAAVIDCTSGRGT